MSDDLKDAIAKADAELAAMADYAGKFFAHGATPLVYKGHDFQPVPFAGVPFITSAYAKLGEVYLVGDGKPETFVPIVNAEAFAEKMTPVGVTPVGSITINGVFDDLFSAKLDKAIKSLSIFGNDYTEKVHGKPADPMKRFTLKGNSVPPNIGVSFVRRVCPCGQQTQMVIDEYAKAVNRCPSCDAAYQDNAKTFRFLDDASHYYSAAMGLNWLTLEMARLSVLGWKIFDLSIPPNSVKNGSVWKLQDGVQITEHMAYGSTGALYNAASQVLDKIDIAIPTPKIANVTAMGDTHEVHAQVSPGHELLDRWSAHFPYVSSVNESQVVSPEQWNASAQFKSLGKTVIAKPIPKPEPVVEPKRDRAKRVINLDE